MEDIPRDEDKPLRKQAPLTPEQEARWRAAVRANSKWMDGQPAAERLKQLWAQTNPRLSTLAIAREMRATKNAIVGAAHRLGLPARPSPIRRGDGPKKAAPPPVIGKRPTLPPLRAALPIPSAAPSPPRVLAPGRTLPPCCWPVGDPGTPEFRMCEEPVERLGRSYCPEHNARAYAKPEARTLGTLQEIERYAADHNVIVPPKSSFLGLLVAVNNHRRKRNMAPFHLAKEPAHG